ncbi:Serine/threonine-protein phosphatase 2A 65 kDa regulatory subunit A beta isoform [Fasciola gigantica]|uniref:Serine/threonine-protein phosphatase 2A 65 kDa regulatory subunit A beta isoform n=1 Tax=Fasciola gigantica TaxID=46835 RepID=A0A504YHM1_FASGI|nr:Serine/threonine-protein phosphatase 2A 65 kDa regulatory subunit A beta isoform [Fasciola gigantica]
MIIQSIRSLVFYRSSLKASELLTCVLREKLHPPWTAFYIRQWDVLDDHWGKSCFNFAVDKINYQILRTACFPLIKYHCTRYPPVELQLVDRFYLLLKIVNLVFVRDFQMSDSHDSYYPIAVLIEELKNEDIQFRLNSIKQLQTIAVALGPEKTRSQLIPFLIDTIYDEDEILLALAEQMGNLVPYVGGPEYASSLLAPLENLVSIESIALAVCCVDKMQILDVTSVTQPIAQIRSDETPMVRRVVAGRLGELALAMIKGVSAESSNGSAEPSANPKTSSTSCVDVAGSKAGDSAPSLSVDDPTNSTMTDGKSNSSDLHESKSSKSAETATLTGSVSNETAAVAGDNNKREDGSSKDKWTDFELDPKAERVHVLSLIVPMFGQLIADDQDSVRLMAVESTVGLIQALGSVEAENELVELIEQAVADKSWRPLFIDLLHDEEAEVRAVAAGKVRAFARCLLGLPPLEPGAESDANQSPSVGTAVVAPSESGEPASSKPPDPTQTNGCPPSSSDINMEEIWALAASDEAIVSSLLPAIKTLTTDSNTHVRSALAGAVLGLAPLLGSRLTVEHLLPVLLAYLKDDSPEVRFNLISNLEHVNSVIGLDHLSSSLLPAVIQLAEDPKWRVRLVIIEYMPMLAEQLGREVFHSQLTDICLGWLTDEVYAIREAAVDNLVRLGQKFGTDWVNETFVPKVAQALSKLGSQLNRKELDVEVHQCLRRLSEDPDRDVKFYACEALDTLHLNTSSDEAGDDGDVVMTPVHPESTAPVSVNEPTVSGPEVLPPQPEKQQA